MSPSNAKRYKEKKNQSQKIIVAVKPNGVPRKETRPMREKPKEKKKEKKVERQIRRIAKKNPSATNINNGNNPAATAQKLIEKFDFGVTPANRQIVRVGQKGVSLLFEALLTQWIMHTPLVVQDTDVDPPSSMEVWFYMWTCWYSLLHTYGHGSLQGGENLPLFSSLQMPLSLAKILQYYMPFVSGDVSYAAAVDQNLDQTVSTHILNKLNVTSAFPLNDKLASGYVSYYSLATDTTYGVFVENTPRFSISYLTFLKTRFDHVQRAVSQNLPSIKATSMKPYAPDAAAYAKRETNNLESPVLFAHATTNLEVATVLSYTTEPGTNGLANLRHAPPRTFRTSGAYGDLTEPAYLAACMAFVLHRMDKWTDGPIQSIPFKGQKLSTFNFAPRAVSGHGLVGQLVSMYQSLGDTNVNFTDDAAENAPGGAYSKFTALWIVMLQSFLLHLQAQSPVFPMSATASGTGERSPQVFYGNTLGGLRIPRAMHDFFMCWGPIVEEGRLIYPLIQVFNADTVAKAKTLFLGNMSGTSIADWKGSNPVNLWPFAPTTATASAPGIVLQDTILDSAYIASYNSLWAPSTTNIVTCLFGSFTNALGNAYAKLFKSNGSVMGGFATLSGPTTKLGRLCTLASGGASLSNVEHVVRQNGKVTLQETHDKASSKVSTISAGDIVVRNFMANRLAASKPLTAEETVMASLFSSSSYDIHSAGYAVQLPRGAGLLQISDGLYQAEVSPNASVGVPNEDELGCEARNGTMIFKKSLPKDDEYAKRFASIRAESSNIAGFASTALCTVVAIGSTQLNVPLLPIAAKKICEAGLGKIVNFLGSRALITSEEYPIPKQVKSKTSMKLGAIFEGFKALAAVAIHDGVITDQESRGLLHEINEMVRLSKRVSGVAKLK